MSLVIATFRLLAVLACHPRWPLCDRHRVSSDGEVVGQRAHTTLGGGVHPRVCASASNVVRTCRPARASREDTHPRCAAGPNFGHERGRERRGGRPTRLPVSITHHSRGYGMGNTKLG